MHNGITDRIGASDERDMGSETLTTYDALAEATDEKTADHALREALDEVAAENEAIRHVQHGGDCQADNCGNKSAQVVDATALCDDCAGDR